MIAPMVRLTFHGAAQTVTGSKYLLEAGDARVLIDCGLFQGLKELREKNWHKLPFEAATVDCVVLTHAHIDHTGYLPRFVRAGFQGPVYCTPPTQDLTELLLLDSAKNQEEEAEYANRKGFSKHKPALPLYDAGDVRKAVKALRPVERETWKQASGPIWFRYHDVGHLLGSAMIEIEVREGNRPLRIVFSGDVGRYGAPLYHDPQPPPACDFLICECTYGNRDHPAAPAIEQLCAATEQAIARGGVMLVAAFAVGRTQQLVFLLRVLMQLGRLPKIPIYIDSPMAVDASAIYAAHKADHDLSELKLLGADSFDADNVHLARSVEESKRLNGFKGPGVIISASGMMTGGRILHHLKQRLPDPKNTILLGGFMPEGTRGRLLVDGAQFLKIHGQHVPVRAAKANASGLSGHAGRSELLRWLEPLPAPRRVFLTHGEKAGALVFAEELAARRGWSVHIPRLGESVDLEHGEPEDHVSASSETSKRTS
jgi:metallo-beta-lactamase family protein